MRIAYLLKPGLFRGRTINVAVETMSPLTQGMIVADWWQITDRPRNVLYLKDADAEGFFDLLADRLALRLTKNPGRRPEMADFRGPNRGGVLDRIETRMRTAAATVSSLTAGLRAGGTVTQR